MSPVTAPLVIEDDVGCWMSLCVPREGGSKSPEVEKRSWRSGLQCKELYQFHWGLCLTSAPLFDRQYVCKGLFCFQRVCCFFSCLGVPCMKDWNGYLSRTAFCLSPVAFLCCWSGRAQICNRGAASCSAPPTLHCPRTLKWTLTYEWLFLLIREGCCNVAWLEKK